MQQSIGYKTINQCYEVNRVFQKLVAMPFLFAAILRTQLLTQCMACDKVLTDPSVSFFAPITLPHRCMEKKVEELNRL